MSCSSVMFSLFLMSPCGQGGGDDVSEAIADAVSNPQRPAEDLAKDTTASPTGCFLFLKSSQE